MSSHLKGPSEGEWSVFAEKVVKERDEARAEVERLRVHKAACCSDNEEQVARLRVALREMVEAHGDSEGATPNRRRQCSCSACETARAALENT